jgi:putative nucleotidyltransferase with HDIG domain
MSQNRFAVLSRGTRAYVTVIVIAGAATVLQSFYALVFHPIGWDWAVLAVLTLVSGSATVRLPSLPATISVSETFVFTSVLLFGSAAGTLTVALDALVISFWSYRKGHPRYKIVFNVCALPLTIWIAAHIFFLFPSVKPLIATKAEDFLGLQILVVPLVCFTVVYFALNSWIITFAISLERGLRPFSIWKDNFLWLSLNYFGGASVAVLLVSYTRDLNYTYLVVIVPLLLVLYFTFSMSMGRVEDANRHLTQLNSLYMSTIETLAMAIDAKDQITHGHIRRVQTYAVALAKEVGLTDTALIKAVEAAALLHDMGKLAVPEYILNKPGPLTRAEFEKMKLHASVGADILSSIEFPYPVVPIVRHHHENWDGTGYPDGLESTNIPIGARILAVVDCFDALTSDRPYRPRLADKDALAILIQRRASMYDPLIVDTFIKVFERIVPPSPTSHADASLSAIAEASTASARNTPPPKRLDEISGSTEEMVTLFDLARGLTLSTRFHDVGEVVSRHVKRLIPCSMCVLFTYDVEADELVAAHASGESASIVSGLTIGIGERLSGWVAANRCSIRNSDPVLDLGETARGLEPRPRSCLASSVVAGRDLLGVLTLYSTGYNAFTEEHQRVLEAVARQVAPIFRRMLGERELSTSTQDTTPGVPNLSPRSLSDPDVHAPISVTSSILFVGVDRFEELSDPVATTSAQKLLSQLEMSVRGKLRVGDFLFRDGNDLVALLVHADLRAAQIIAMRVQNTLNEDELTSSARFSVSVVAADIHADDASIQQAVERARVALKRGGQSLGSKTGNRPGSIH